MPRKKALKKKVIMPIAFDEPTYDRLRKVANEVGEAESVMARLILRAGLTAIEQEGIKEIFPKLLLSGISDKR